MISQIVLHFLSEFKMDGDTPRVIAPLAPTPRMESAYKKFKQARGPADPQTADARERLMVAYEIAK